MTKKITFCAMMSVMATLCLILSNIFQTTTIFLYLLSTLFTHIATEEYGIKYGLLTATVVNVAGFIFTGRTVGTISYIIIASYYPVVKHIIEHFEIKMIFKKALKLLYALVTASIAYLMVKSIIILTLPLWVIYLSGIIIFLLYDKALDIGIKFYAIRLRKFK